MRMARSGACALRSNRSREDDIRVEALVLSIGLALAGEARADRFVVQVGALPPVHVNDCESYSANLGGSEPGLEPATGQAASFDVAPPPPAPDITVPSDQDRSAHEVSPDVPPITPGPVADPDDAGDPANPGPSPEFLAELADNYRVTDPADAQAIWKWYVKEPPELGNVEKTGNAAIRQILATNAPLVPTSTARPDRLKPDATSGTVRSNSGVSIHSSPWGPKTGAIPFGTNVTIQPPANEVWYNIPGTGWACGLWIELR
jgi:hypothetical protein